MIRFSVSIVDRKKQKLHEMAKEENLRICGYEYYITVLLPCFSQPSFNTIVMVFSPFNIFILHRLFHKAGSAWCALSKEVSSSAKKKFYGCPLLTVGCCIFLQLVALDAFIKDAGEAIHDFLDGTLRLAKGEIERLRPTDIRGGLGLLSQSLSCTGTKA